MQKVRYLCQIQLSDLEGDDQRPVPTSFHEHIGHTIAGETVGKVRRVEVGRSRYCDFGLNGSLDIAGGFG